MNEEIRIVIVTSGAAFDDAPGSEVARLLSELARQFAEDGGPTDGRGRLIDSNGNICGTVEILPEGS
ncbi:MAG: hypothetical protein KDB94_06080 [Acidobacteria bacterium]|nr:hypothetical protein [Acidobacteriota bacterium]